MSNVCVDEKSWYEQRAAIKAEAESVWRETYCVEFSLVEIEKAIYSTTNGQGSADIILSKSDSNFMTREQATYMARHWRGFFGGWLAHKNHIEEQQKSGPLDSGDFNGDPFPR